MADLIRFMRSVFYIVLNCSTLRNRSKHLILKGKTAFSGVMFYVLRFYARLSKSAREQPPDFV